MLEHHRGAIDYDLMTMTSFTIDDVGGRLPLRSLAHFVRHLPPTSATMRALHPDDAERVTWMEGKATAELLACLIDEVRGMQWMYESAHSRSRPRRPKPFPTPWRTDDADTRRIGSGAITIADFDAWFDGEV